MLHSCHSYVVPFEIPTGFQMVQPFEYRTLKSQVFRWIRYSDGHCIHQAGTFRCSSKRSFWCSRFGSLGQLGPILKGTCDKFQIFLIHFSSLLLGTLTQLSFAFRLPMFFSFPMLWATRSRRSTPSSYSNRSDPLTWSWTVNQLSYLVVSTLLFSQR